MPRLISILILLTIIGCSSIHKEDGKKYKNIITKYTEIKEIHSKEVKDTFYVFIRLPKKYNENSNKKYPVLYLLDGDISFNMATSVVRYLQFGKDIPDLIIVAPAYGTMLNDTETNYRERDYTFSKIERFKESGGGTSYLNFLKNELIPMVDSSYRTNKQKILNGYSLGGLFTINTLLTEPNLFTDYIAGSPYLSGNLESLLLKLDTIKFSNYKNVFVSVGETESKETYKDPINHLVKKLSGFNEIKIEKVIFENGTHFTCPPEALGYGLKFIFRTTNKLEQ